MFMTRESSALENKITRGESQGGVVEAVQPSISPVLIEFNVMHFAKLT